MAPLPGVGASQETTTYTKKESTEKKVSGSGQPNTVFGSKELDSGVQGQVSNITSDLMTGKFDIGKTLTNINTMIQKALAGTVKSQIVDMLLGGNDLAEATAAKGETAAHVTRGGVAISKLQDKLITANLDALQELLTNGEIDIQTYSNSLMNSMIEVGVKGCEIDILGEQNEELTKKNEELEEKIKEKLKDKEITMEKDKDGNMVFKDSSGNIVDPKENDGVGDLLAQIQTNSSTISNNKEAMTNITQMNKVVTDNVVGGIQDVVVKGNDLGTTIANVAANMITDGSQEITNTLLDNIGLLENDAVTAGVNGAKDTIAEAAAPGVAAGITAGTLGSGSGQAAKVISNGIADGFASGIRALTGSTAMGGIVTNLTAGQALGQAVSNTLISESRSYINDQIMEGVKDFTDPLKDISSTETKNTNERENKYDIETDENSKA